MRGQKERVNNIPRIACSSFVRRAASGKALCEDGKANDHSGQTRLIDLSHGNEAPERRETDPEVFYLELGRTERDADPMPGYTRLTRYYEST